MKAIIPFLICFTIITTSCKVKDHRIFIKIEYIGITDKPYPVINVSNDEIFLKKENSVFEYFFKLNNKSMNLVNSFYIKESKSDFSVKVKINDKEYNLNNDDAKKYLTLYLNNKLKINNKLLVNKIEEFKNRI